MVKKIDKNIRYNGGFDYFRVILFIALVLATITLLIFFDGIMRRKHLIANKKNIQSTPYIQIQTSSVTLYVEITFEYSELLLSVVASFVP